MDLLSINFHSFKAALAIHATSPGSICTHTLSMFCVILPHLGCCSLHELLCQQLSCHGKPSKPELSWAPGGVHENNIIKMVYSNKHKRRLPENRQLIYIVSSSFRTIGSYSECNIWWLFHVWFIVLASAIIMWENKFACFHQHHLLLKQLTIMPPVESS